MADDDDIQRLAEELRAGLVIKDRKWMLKTFPSCFIGSECVTYMVDHGHARTRKDAIALGQSLLEGGQFFHVTKDHQFKDEYLFYRFEVDSKKKKRVANDKVDISSWSDLLPGSNSSGGDENCLPNIPHGFVDEDMNAFIMGEASPLSPMDEYNAVLLDNVHPPSWSDPKSEGVYNMVVIGAGAGGLVTAAGSAGVGAKVAIIERHLLGGDCLNFGCVPSKALLRTAKAVSEMKHSHELGVHIEGEVVVDFPAVMQRMRRLRASISPNDSADRFEKLGIDVFIGEASFVSKSEVQVNGQTLKFARACIAVGATAAVPPIPGVETVPYLTNETIFNLTELPRSMIVVGGGSVGCELAQSFACFGTEVHLTCRSSCVLHREEEEAGKIVQEALVADGVNVIPNVTYGRFSYDPDVGTITLEYDDPSGHHQLTAESVLLAVGRSPNVSALKLEAAKVRFDTRQGIHVNNHLQTSNKNIYAVGDCCTKYKFTHVADFMARTVIRNALFFGSAKFSDLVIPWATYTKPELAHVGLYEKDLVERNIPYDVYSKQFEDLDRAILDGEQGYIKVLTTKGSDRIVGCTIVGARAGDMIGEVTLAMTNKIGLGSIALTIHPYPTSSECIRQVGDLYNRTRLTPSIKLIFRNLLSARRNTRL